MPRQGSYNQSHVCGIVTMKAMKPKTMFAWEDYKPCPFIPAAPASIRIADIERALDELKKLRPTGMNVEEIGKSYEDRPIYSVTLGSGPTRVFLWSQMHGNEPTHTAVLLDLIDLFQRQPDAEISRDILSECTLTMIPMLNPDGAERYIRRNAQDIDLNRDALHLATPEGRLLRAMVEKIKPQFAFNLHNQQPGTSVDGFKVAAVSLLVPPIDAPDTQTEWTEQAKQVAVTFLDAVKPHCEGMISRYDADFMPRCFGEWVQQQKIATLTIEAGGWSNVDTSPLVQLHFLGTINALSAIANGCCAMVDAADYDALPRSSDQNLFDVVVRDAVIVPDQKHDPYKADLGINFTKQKDRTPIERGGRIDDFGDLCVTTGKRVFEDADLSCVPGRIVFDPNVTPTKLPSESQARDFLKQGITTVIGVCPVADSTELDALGKLHDIREWPLNVGFVGKLEPGDDQDQLIRAIALGVLAILSTDQANQVASWFTLSTLTENDLIQAESPIGTLAEYVVVNRKLAEKLKLGSRGTIKLGSTADLIFISKKSTSSASWKDLARVMLGGKVVLEKGEFLAGASGELLLR